MEKKQSLFIIFLLISFTFSSWSQSKIPNIFTLGVWLQSPTRERNGKNNAENYKSLGINTFIGLWEWPSEQSMGTGYNLLAAEALKNSGLFAYAGNSQAAVDWIRNHPEYRFTLIGYMLGDEPDMFKVNGDPEMQPDNWKTRGMAIRLADQDRGLFANFGKGFALDPWAGYNIEPGPSREDDLEKYILPLTSYSSDFYAITDPYEVENQHGIWGYGRAIENSKKYANGRFVYGFVECSAPWTDVQASNNPTIPRRMTADLLRSAVWIMVVHGAKGIIYFCHDFSNGGMIEDAVFDEPGMTEAMSEVNKSIKNYENILLADTIDGISTETDNSVKITTLVKKFNGYVYIFAMGDGNTNYPEGNSVIAEISINERKNIMVDVLEENRTISMKAGKFSDLFNAYELHIYRYYSGESPLPPQGIRLK